MKPSYILVMNCNTFKMFTTTSIYGIYDDVGNICMFSHSIDDIEDGMCFKSGENIESKNLIVVMPTYVDITTTVGHNWAYIVCTSGDIIHLITKNKHIARLALMKESTLKVCCVKFGENIKIKTAEVTPYTYEEIKDIIVSNESLDLTRCCASGISFAYNVVVASEFRKPLHPQHYTGHSECVIGKFSGILIKMAHRRYR